MISGRGGGQNPQKGHFTSKNRENLELGGGVKRPPCPLLRMGLALLYCNIKIKALTSTSSRAISPNTDEVDVPPLTARNNTLAAESSKSTSPCIHSSVPFSTRKSCKVWKHEC